MGELRQHNPSLKVSQVKELPKGDLLIIRDSMQDMLILQNETKMKAALGKNVRISLPKAYQINKSQNKRLAVKFIPNIKGHVHDYTYPGATFVFCSHGEK